MNNHNDHAKQDLAELPPSPEKDFANRLLLEIEESERETDERLRKLDLLLDKLQISPREALMYRIITWIAIGLGMIAMYNGGYALAQGEFCYWSRGREICDHGTRGSIEGAVLLGMGVLMAAAPLPSSRKKAVILSLLGILCFAGLLASMLIRY